MIDTSGGKVFISLSISAEEYLKTYQTVGRVVVTPDLDGKRVRFPASILRPFVTHRGINGLFEIAFDKQGKFSSIRRL